MRKEIHNFSQRDGEIVFEARKRFKELLRRFPHNGMEQWMQLQDFWDDLNLSSRRLLNSAVVGPLMKRTPEEIVTLLNELSEDAEQWSTNQGDQKRLVGVHQVESLVAMQDQIAAMDKDIKQMMLVQVKNQSHVGCDICGLRHPTHECQATPEEVNALGNVNRGNYQGGGNFNSMGQRHPGFSWSSSTRSLNSWQKQNPRAPVQGPPERAPGALPADTKKNPKETIKAVFLWSGKTLAEPKAKPRDEKEINSTKIAKEQKIGESLPKENVNNKDVDKQKVNNAVEESKHMPLLPFPQKMKREKLDKCFRKFLEMLKQLYVNIPCTEVFTQIPAYAKFLKKILSSKKKLEEMKVVKLNAHCSSIIHNKIPKKCGDPGSFTIPCSLGSEKFDKGLCDSDASINLMPLSMFKKLEGELGVIKSVPVSLQLADQTTIIPEGIVEDILVRVDKYVFPVDFIVVDMEENKEVPLIMGRPFLCTGRAILDIYEGATHATSGKRKSGEQEHMLVELLRKHKKAIGWSMADIHGISPTICMHKILLEERSKPVVQPQRKLNKNLEEVVQKEILKFLDASIIFSISGS
ncbi:uncharacterized protein [Nicotiana tomentosiformis]|uniref:uncharacterized protein n=1 Tax=Nicotiana tomentosiformis TaxID=4098 RepID=UPI00051B2F15|nr:uncharacterized protein LOC104111704 [Nicotiana tomentosiformis]